MNKPTIAVDIDDVLAAHAEGFVHYSNETWGTNLSPDDYQEHWADMWGIDHEETNQRAITFHASGAVSKYRHYPEAIGVLRHLKETYRLIIVTSRRKVVEDETKQWLNINFPDLFNAVHFAGIFDGGVDEKRFSKTKLAVMQAQQADYLIDDQLKHCIAAAESGRKAVLFGKYPWNVSPHLPAGIVRCEDWDAVLEYFDEQG